MNRIYTLEEALKRLTSKLPYLHRQFGTRIVIGNHHEYVELSLSVFGIDGEMAVSKRYNYLLIKHILKGSLSNTFCLRLSDRKYSPPNSIHQGGYYWSVDNQFYRYEPNLEVLTEDLTSIISFLDIPNR